MHGITRLRLTTQVEYAVLDLYDELVRIINELNKRQIPYALCGGLAVSLYTRPRATVDIDLLVSQDAFPAARQAVIDEGYDTEAHPMLFAEGKVPIRRLSKLDPQGDILSIDFLLVTDATEAVWNSRKEMQWAAGKLSVVSREGLIELKKLRRSGQDLDDIRNLENTTDA